MWLLLSLLLTAHLLASYSLTYAHSEEHFMRVCAQGEVTSYSLAYAHSEGEILRMTLKCDEFALNFPDIYRQ